METFILKCVTMIVGLALATFAGVLAILVVIEDKHRRKAGVATIIMAGVLTMLAIAGPAFIIFVFKALQ